MVKPTLVTKLNLHEEEKNGDEKGKEPRFQSQIVIGQRIQSIISMEH